MKISKNSMLKLLSKLSKSCERRDTFHCPPLKKEPSKYIYLILYPKLKTSQPT